MECSSGVVRCVYCRWLHRVWAPSGDSDCTPAHSLAHEPITQGSWLVSLTRAIPAFLLLPLERLQPWHPEAL